MFVVFLMFTTGRIIWECASCLRAGSGPIWWFHLLALLPVSCVCFGGMLWMLFDASWLNLEDPEKDSKLLTSRWLKFSPLLLMIALLAINTHFIPGKVVFYGSLVDCVLDSIVYLCAYGSLCVAHDRGFGRLFQPFAVLRTKEYIDEKGQKFDVNFIGTTANILCLGASSWFYFLRQQLFFLICEVALLGQRAFIILRHSMVVLLILCTMGVMFFSCVKVTFFLARSKWNYLKFSPVLLAPFGILCSQLLSPSKSDFKEKVMMVVYAAVAILAYLSLLSPPDSLLAVAFQPYTAMVDLVQDLPTSESSAKPHVKKNVIEPAAVTRK